jgi:hypothetical protein
MKCDWLGVCNKEFIKFDDGIYRCPNMNYCKFCGTWTHGSHQCNTNNIKINKLVQ